MKDDEGRVDLRDGAKTVQQKSVTIILKCFCRLHYLWWMYRRFLMTGDKVVVSAIFNEEPSYSEAL